MPDSTITVEITALTVYPVKALRGISLASALLTPLGIEHDRSFMLVRSDGSFVTQRDTPEMALIETAIEPGGLVLSREGCGFVRVPFGAEDGDRVMTRVWKDDCETIEQGEVISRWLTEALHSRDTLRLVAMAPGYRRPLEKADRLGDSTETLFADAAPYLVANESSLEALNAHLLGNGSRPVPMDRFRPNIVVSGLPAFSEHRSARLANTGCELRLHYPCERCVVTTIDQATGVKSPDHEPYRSLAAINPMPGRDRKPAFGQNATLASDASSSIRIGDVMTAHMPQGLG